MAAAKRTHANANDNEKTDPQNEQDGAQAAAGNGEGNNEGEENNDKRKTRGPQKVFYTCAAIKNVAKRDDDGKVIKEDGKNVTEPTLILDEYEVPSPTDKQFAMDRFESNTESRRSPQAARTTRCATSPRSRPRFRSTCRLAT